MTPTEEIKQRLDIVEFIKSHIKLDKTGANWRGLCPFHSERTPSFFVSPSRQMWHCFGSCSEGGDIFKFLMKLENIEFPEALKILAEKAGVELKFESAQDRSRRQKSFEVLETAQKYWQNQLLDDSPQMDYLLKRGLKKETIGKFGLGWAGAGWQNLFDHLRSSGFAAEEISEAGLAIKSSKVQNYSAPYYDRFRSRIMFPIRDSQSRVIGFTGRIFEDTSTAGKDPSELAAPASTPARHASQGEAGGSSRDVGWGGKYVNTPETPLFQKRKILYGFDVAKNDIRLKNEAILVEGQMDFLMALQDGVKNIVATSGTALDGFQLRTIRRLAEKLILAFDHDSAGSEATERSIRLASSLGFEIRIFTTPQGKDIADYVLMSPGNLAASFEKSRPIMEYYFERASEKYGDPSELSEKKKIAAYLLPRIKSFSNAIDQAVWLGKLSDTIGIGESFLLEELNKVKLEEPAEKRDSELQEDLRSLGVKSRHDIVAERVLGLATVFPEAQAILQTNLVYFPSNFQPLATRFCQDPKSLFSDSKFSEAYSHIMLIPEYEATLDPDFNAEKEFNVAMDNLKTEFKKQERFKLAQEIKKAEASGDAEKLSQLIERFKQVDVS